MAYSKAAVFETTDKELALFAKALAHPARIAILRYLAQRNECICGDIVSELPLSQSTVSQHLKELKECGLVQGTIDGPRVCYCIHPENWQKAREALGDFFETSLASSNSDCSC